MNGSDLIQILSERQRKAGESDGAFAARLGLSRQAWNFLRNGKFQPSVETLRAIHALYPDLRPDIEVFVLPKTASKQAKNGRIVKSAVKER